MKRKIFWVAFFAVTTALAGCSGSSSSGLNKEVVGGNWSGSWTSSNGQGGGLSGSWTQNGSTFSGPVKVNNSDCFGKEFATGTVSGSTINLGLVNNGILFEGSISGNTISGTYVVYCSGYCYGDAGTFVLRR